MLIIQEQKFRTQAWNPFPRNPWGRWLTAARSWASCLQCQSRNIRAFRSLRAARRHKIFRRAETCQHKGRSLPGNRFVCCWRCWGRRRRSECPSPTGNGSPGRARSWKMHNSSCTSVSAGSHSPDSSCTRPRTDSWPFSECRSVRSWLRFFLLSCYCRLPLNTQLPSIRLAARSPQSLWEFSSARRAKTHRQSRSDFGEKLLNKNYLKKFYALGLKPFPDMSEKIKKSRSNAIWAQSFSIYKRVFKFNPKCGISCITGNVYSPLIIWTLSEQTFCRIELNLERFLTRLAHRAE